MRKGDTVAVMDWDTPRYLESFFAIPMILASPAARDHDFSGCRVIIRGSALSKALCQEAMSRGIDVNVAYGMSENSKERESADSGARRAPQARWCAPRDWHGSCCTQRSKELAMVQGLITSRTSCGTQPRSSALIRLRI